MNETWWKSAKEVDPDQVRIYSLPVAGRHFVIGPPGSGKTNVLLLRAVYLARAGRSNLKVLSFSKSLVEFIRSGVRENGLIPADRIDTIAGWQIRLFRELTGRKFDLTDTRNHDLSRRERNSQLLEAISKAKLQSTHYDALLIDEAQDLLADEVKIISMLSDNLFFVADSRQRIYNENEGIEAIRALGCAEHALRYHYRIGRKICVAADRILPSQGSLLSEFSQYDEVSLPSSVGVKDYPARADQMRAIVERLETQLRAYPDEWIGVIAPKNYLLNEFEDFIDGSRFEDLVSIHREGHRNFDSERPIVALTVHSAKGTEFRAVHLLAAEEFGHWYKREFGFTAITRAKTAVDCYYTGQADGSLIAALSEERMPDPREVFP